MNSIAVSVSFTPGPSRGPRRLRILLRFVGQGLAWRVHVAALELQGRDPPRARPCAGPGLRAVSPAAAEGALGSAAAYRALGTRQKLGGQKSEMPLGPFWWDSSTVFFVFFFCGIFFWGRKGDQAFFWGKKGDRGLLSILMQCWTCICVTFIYVASPSSLGKDPLLPTTQQVGVFFFGRRASGHAFLSFLFGCWLLSPITCPCYWILLASTMIFLKSQVLTAA